eukprot:CAMPEP_0206806090 /NCGR_PEP_ID=MMETSP0975-20121206/4551_1 /ASSEMBLY_ACC=CAM_ASM_000399 /TAXON_ID=483370 /ORGANISM="non described non described, Strain CCMP2097" /LENGTH=551 /DNA_ID=CAMNT_0054348147 /DNA_START=34 /DNA_END=1689 /DNA_ORIENTATION=+
MARLLLALALPAAAKMEMSAKMGGMDKMMNGKERALELALESEGDHIAMSNVKCVDGFAGEYPCKDVDLLSFTPRRELYGSTVHESKAFNDMWGWTDAFDGHEYVLLGAQTGTTFVDITDPLIPVVVGFAETGGDCTGENYWRDIKTVGHYAYIVADRVVGAGLQVVDLTQLRGRSAMEPARRALLFGHMITTEAPTKMPTEAPTAAPTMKPTPAKAVYQVCNNSTVESHMQNDVLDQAHNIVAFSDEDVAAGATPLLIGVGAKDAQGVRLCNGGLALFGLNDPLAPNYLGCFGDRYTHDAQCVLYHGPDTRYTGRELCFCLNTNEISVVDITDKSDLQLVARVWGCDAGVFQPLVNEVYGGGAGMFCSNSPNRVETPGGPFYSWSPGYVHQGWLSEDHARFILGDEGDEEKHIRNVSSYYFDVSDLTGIMYQGQWVADYTSVDHNLYIKDGLSYHADYTAGLRIRSTDFETVTELAHFDVSPEYLTGFTDPEVDGPIGNGVAFRSPALPAEFTWLGAWGVYPFFKSGTVALSSVDRGLFLFKYTGPTAMD